MKLKINKYILVAIFISLGVNTASAQISDDRDMDDLIPTIESSVLVIQGNPEQSTPPPNIIIDNPTGGSGGSDALEEAENNSSDDGGGYNTGNTTPTPSVSGDNANKANGGRGKPENKIILPRPITPDNPVVLKGQRIHIKTDNPTPTMEGGLGHKNANGVLEFPGSFVLSDPIYRNGFVTYRTITLKANPGKTIHSVGPIGGFTGENEDPTAPPDFTDPRVNNTNSVFEDNVATIFTINGANGPEPLDDTNTGGGSSETGSIWYFDGDLDEYHSRQVRTARKPEGPWRSYTFGFDCDDRNRFEHVNCTEKLWYLDYDGDGYHGEEERSVDKPDWIEGFSLTTNGHECDDDDPNRIDDCEVVDEGRRKIMKMKQFFDTSTDPLIMDLRKRNPNVLFEIVDEIKPGDLQGETVRIENNTNSKINISALRAGRSNHTLLQTLNTIIHEYVHAELNRIVFVAADDAREKLLMDRFSAIVNSRRAGNGSIVKNVTGRPLEGFENASEIKTKTYDGIKDDYQHIILVESYANDMAATLKNVLEANPAIFGTIDATDLSDDLNTYISMVLRTERTKPFYRELNFNNFSKRDLAPFFINSDTRTNIDKTLKAECL